MTEDIEGILRRRLSMTPPVTPPRQILTPEEIMQQISDMAQFGQGNDRRWALDRMRSATAEQTNLAPILSERDVIMRGARLMRGYGEVIARRMFEAAFPKGARAKEITVADPTETPIEHLPTTLEELYQRWPGKRPVGYPKGYPYRKTFTDEDRVAWVKRKAQEFITGDKRRLRREARQAKKAETEGMDAGSSEPVG